MDLKEALNNFKFQLLTDFTPKRQKYLLTCLNLPSNCDLTIYAKVVEQLIEFSDGENNPLYSTTIRFASFVLLTPNGAIFDKFVCPITIFRIRNGYEQQTITEIIGDLSSELEVLDAFIIQNETEDNCHEA